MDITLQRRMLVLVLSVALAVVVAMVLPNVASAAPPDSSDPLNNGGAPDAVNSSVITVGSCAFPVRIDIISGKEKTLESPPIETPGGNTTIVTSPGKRVILTNLADPTKQVSYVISGVYHQTELPSTNPDEESEGDLVEVVTTGQVLLFDRSFGMYLIDGRSTFVLDDEGFFVEPPTTDTGHIVKVCTILE